MAHLPPAHPTPAAAAIALHIRGRVTSSACRFTRAGVPVVVLEMRDVPTGQVIAITHRYPDASAASAQAARALAQRLQGQHAELQAIHPRFKAQRLECDAYLIHTPATTTRKDLA